MSSDSEKTDGKKIKIMDYVRELETKGNAFHSGIETVKSVAAAGAGVYLGACIGRPSLLVGLIPTFAGYYFEVPKLTQLGVGMIATGGYQLQAKGFGATEIEGFEGIKERAKQVTSSFKHSLYLDKIFKPKTTEKKDENTAGLDEGAVQYFKYPSNEINMGSLEAIEQEITKSGERFAKKYKGSNDDDFSGIEERLF